MLGGLLEYWSCYIGGKSGTKFDISIDHTRQVMITLRPCPLSPIKALRKIIRRSLYRYLPNLDLPPALKLARIMNIALHTLRRDRWGSWRPHRNMRNFSKCPDCTALGIISPLCQFRQPVLEPCLLLETSVQSG